MMSCRDNAGPIPTSVRIVDLDLLKMLLRRTLHSAKSPGLVFHTVRTPFNIDFVENSRANGTKFDRNWRNHGGALQKGPGVLTRNNSMDSARTAEEVAICKSQNPMVDRLTVSTNNCGWMAVYCPCTLRSLPAFRAFGLN